MNLSRTAEDHDKDQPFAADLSVHIYPLTSRYGILGTGIVAAVPFPFALVLILSFSEAGRIIDQSFLTIVKNIAPATVGSLIMALLVLLLQQLISHLPPALVLVLSIGLGAVCEDGAALGTIKLRRGVY